MADGSAEQSPSGACYGVVADGQKALRALIAASAGQVHHGYAETAGSLGVPELPNLGEVTSMLNGTTRMRTWYGAPDRWRFDVLTAAGERDVYVAADHDEGRDRGRDDGRRDDEQERPAPRAAPAPPHEYIITPCRCSAP